jgi:hypothetical protein
MKATRSFETSRTASPKHGVRCRKPCAVSTAAVGTACLSLGQHWLTAALLLQLTLVISRLHFHVVSAGVDDYSLPLLSSVAVTSLAAELAFRIGTDRNAAAESFIQCVVLSFVFDGHLNRQVRFLLLFMSVVLTSVVSC